MRPQLLTFSGEPGHSFSVKRALLPDDSHRWHFHTEVELVHFESGSGTQFVGDNVKSFRAGDIVLVGTNLPHCWRVGGTSASAAGDHRATVRTAHFRENFWGGTFLELPENIQLKALLEKAGRGLQVEGAAKKAVAALLETLLDSEGMPRLLGLMELLQVLAGSDELQPLASIGFKHCAPEAEQQRLQLVYAHSLRHFRRAISLEEIAAAAAISPNSFCRFFKSSTGKTYSRFLLELKAGHACKLLIENNLSIKRICYESGFNNFTSFYKYFKLITGKSPLGYQREFIGAIKQNHHEKISLDTYPVCTPAAESAVPFP